MPYSNFTLKKVQQTFQLGIVEQLGIFSDLEELQVSQLLSDILKENVPLAIAINTEKARSELIISPILVEIRKHFKRNISLFSGIEFSVNPDQELNGYCDFIISNSPEQLFLKSPVITLVEAKNENVMNGLGQCLAEMVAARIFNDQEGNPIPNIYGAVTSGTAWKFLKLEGSVTSIDLADYGINQPNKILGILSAMITQIA